MRRNINMPKTFSIINETSSKLLKLPFESIKLAALGKNYSLNLIIASPARLKKLNTIYRDKEYATDILSFPVSEKEGEIYISLAEAKKEASKFGRTYENFLAFLFIHGCVHLKGHDHSSTMEKIEMKLRKKFNI
jgi:probable rRNA maturation factor